MVLLANLFICQQYVNSVLLSLSCVNIVAASTCFYALVCYYSHLSFKKSQQQRDFWSTGSLTHSLRLSHSSSSLALSLLTTSNCDSLFSSRLERSSIIWGDKKKRTEYKFHDIQIMGFNRIVFFLLIVLFSGK